MLGRYYELRGKIVKGLQRGRTIGFPTANLAATVDFAPRFGVYATTSFTQGQWWKGVSNIGVNPTVVAEPGAARAVKIETHLFDFSKDIYGQDFILRCHQFLRPEQKFQDFAELQRQIQQDAVQAREVLQ
jgi:riboflavin kinase/FMN adenylyltransferase